MVSRWVLTFGLHPLPRELWYLTINNSGIFPLFLVKPKTLQTILYGFSVLCGPALAIGIASIWCLVPFHNVLEEPCYWYEYHISSALLVNPFMTWTGHPMVTEYLANFSVNGSIKLFILLCIISCGTRITAAFIYYFNWTGLAQPMPLGSLITGTIAYLATVILALFR